MVYSVSLAPLENFSIIAEDRNTRRSLGNRDEAACITYLGYKPGSTIDPLTISEFTHIVTEFEERQGG